MKNTQLAFLFLAAMVAGVLIARFGLEKNPALAVGTDRSGEYIMTSGPVDGDVSATYFLDSTTGVITATVLSNQRPGIQALYKANVTMDLGKFITIKKVGANGQPLTLPTKPNYVMSAATIDLRRQGSKLIPAYAPLTLVETNTGIMMVYIIQWDRTKHSQNLPVQAALTPYTAEQINFVNKREE